MRALALSTLILATACGGGGGGASQALPPAPAPTAAPVQPQTIAFTATGGASLTINLPTCASSLNPVRISDASPPPFNIGADPSFQSVGAQVQVGFICARGGDSLTVTNDRPDLVNLVPFAGVGVWIHGLAPGFATITATDLTNARTATFTVAVTTASFGVK